MDYKPTKWENRVYDEEGNILREGTGLWAEYLNNIEEGIVRLYEGRTDLVKVEEGKSLTSNDFTDYYKESIDRLKEDIKVFVEKEEGKSLSSNDFTDFYKGEIDNLDKKLNGYVEKVSGKGLSTKDFTERYKKELDDYIDRKAKQGLPGGVVILDSKGQIPSKNIPGEFKSNTLVGSVEEMEKLEDKFEGLRVTVLDKEKGTWEEYMFDGVEYVKLSASTDMDIVIDWKMVEGKPSEYRPAPHTHTEKDLEGVNKYTREEVDDKLKSKADKDHTHTLSEIDNLNTYSKEDIDRKVNSKADEVHRHKEQDIVDLDKYSKAETNKLLEGKSDTKHSHTEYLRVDGKDKKVVLGKDLMFETMFENDNWSFINNYTGGGWARGLLNIKNKEGSNYFQIGGNGNGQDFTRLYLGKSWEDWNLSIDPNKEEVEVKGRLLENGERVALDKDKSDKGHTHTELHSHSNKHILDKLRDLGGHSTIDLDRIYTHKHSYRDLDDKPSIPTRVSDLRDTEGLVTTGGSPVRLYVSDREPLNAGEGDIWIKI